MAVSKRRGKWVLDFYDQNKMRRWVTTRYPAEEKYRALAERELARYAIAVEDHTFRSQTQQRDFAQLVESWTAALDVRDLTRADYLAVVKHHLVPFFGDSKLRAVTVQRVEEFRACMQEKGLSVRTTNKALTQLYSMMKYAVGNGWLTTNPCAQVKKLRQPIDHRRRAMDGNILTWNEVQTLIGAAGSQRDATLIRMAFETGMREGELFALRWTDVELPAARVTVRRSYRKRVESAPKTAASMRTIGLTAQMVSKLREWRLACPQPPGCLGLVFPNGAGRHESHYNFLHRGWYPALERAKLRRVRFHDARHTCASLLLAAGVSVHAVQAQLGHASPSITLNVYGHLMPNSGSPGAAAFQALHSSVVVAPTPPTAEPTTGLNVIPMPVRTVS
jgi:integrase